MKTALVPLAEGFEELEAVAAIDVLRRGGVEVVTAALGGGRGVVSAHGVALLADALLEDVLESPYDAIILPGGGKGTENLLACEPLAARLRRQKAEGRFTCAICAAPTVLAAAGVLEGERVTCYPTCAAAMGRPVEDVPSVADGRVVTGQGPGAAVAFALAVLAQLQGAAAAESVAKGMVVAP